VKQTKENRTQSQEHAVAELASDAYQIQIHVRRLRLIVIFILLTVAFAGTMAILLMALAQRESLREKADIQRRVQEENIMAMEHIKEVESRLALENKENVALIKELRDAEKSGKVIKYSEGLNPQDRQLLDQISNTQAQLDKRISELESAIMMSPEKAVGLPMLRQQLIDVQDRIHGDVDNIHGEIGRLNNLLIGFLGLMITLILGVGGMVLTFKGSVMTKRQVAETEKYGDAKP
jgi:hypothetical protein